MYHFDMDQRLFSQYLDLFRLPCVLGHISLLSGLEALVWKYEPAPVRDERNQKDFLSGEFIDGMHSSKKKTLLDQKQTQTMAKKSSLSILSL